MALLAGAHPGLDDPGAVGEAGHVGALQGDHPLLHRHLGQGVLPPLPTSTTSNTALFLLDARHM